MPTSTIHLVVNGIGDFTEFWDEALLQAPTRYRRIIESLLRYEEVVLPRRKGVTFVQWCATVDGWDAGPSYCPCAIEVL